jgi:glucose/arabinose dehydrogenase
MNRLLRATLLVCLAACGQFPEPSKDTGLAVTVEGLPSGVAADIVITGSKGFTQSIVATQTLSDIPADTYTLEAGTVVNGFATYIPRDVSQSVSVSPGVQTKVTVTYDPGETLQIGLEQVATGLNAPVFLTAPANDPRLFVVERAGRIRVIEDGDVVPTPVLDISARVDTTGERGLLSLAFDPQFATNRLFYVYFTEKNTGAVAVERFQMASGDPNVAETTPFRILTIPHGNFSNHNGGHLAFGADGFLYVSVGDGGGAGDPFNNAQDLGQLLGKLLRIDVAQSNFTQPYAIPSSNPFVGQAGRSGEIWAYGLSNPWRFAFDTEAGLLYIADVGESQREEVDVAAAATAGLNYGWRIMEGSLCFAAAGCATAGLTLPVLEYNHDASGGCSIIGGFVYRGSELPELVGRFFYSDFCSGFLRSFRYGGGQAAEQIDWNIASVGSIVSFGEDADGELYVLTTGNVIYRIVRQ